MLDQNENMKLSFQPKIIVLESEITIHDNMILNHKMSQ